MPSLVEKAIDLAVNGLNNLNGTHFLDELVRQLSELIGSDYTFVSELSEDCQNAKTRALHAKSQNSEGFSYPLEGTPCQGLITNDACCFPQGIPNLFPDDQFLIDMEIEGYLGISLRNNEGRVFGIMAALFKQPITKKEQILSAFKVLSIRAAAELERAQYEQALKYQINDLAHQNEQLRVAQQIYDYTSDGIIVTDSDNNIIYINERIEQMSGYNKEELLGKSPRRLNSGLQSIDFYKQLWQSLQTNGHWQGEFLNRHKDGTTYPIATAITVIPNEKGEPRKHVAIHRDITKEKQTQKLINFQATHDLLTGLLNRHEMSKQIDHHICNSKPNEKQYAFILFDLNNFSEINDNLGYKQGDACLRETAKRIRAGTPDQATIARLSADQFAALIAIEKREDVDQLLKSITNEFDDPFVTPNNYPQKLSLSIGVSFYPNDSSNAEDLHINAEEALRLAKTNSKESTILFNSGLKKQVERRKRVRYRLKLAIRDRLITPFFQPIIDIKTGKLTHCEALARWHDEELGQVFPDEFIPISEEFGLTTKLGLLMSEKSIQAISQLNQRFNQSIGVTINRSPQEFNTIKSQDPLVEIARKNNYPLEKVTIELTESLMIHNPRRAKEQLNKLRDLGFVLAMDDFGTGYSSLAYLKNLPFHALKIDRSFVQDIYQKVESKMLVKAIIEMAKNFKMKTIAEGVEDAKQLEILKKLGCDYAQGYYFSKPLPIKHFEKYLISEHLDSPPHQENMCSKINA